MKHRPDIDETVDLGKRGVSRTPGLCNYQWGVTGPLGAVIFYCTKTEPCDGDPHRVEFGGEEFGAAVEWRAKGDLALRGTKRGDADEFYLLSIKHGAGRDEFLWWGPNGCGYSLTLDGAGIYTRKQVAEDRRFCNEGTVPVPVPIVNQHARRVVPVTSGLRAAFERASFEALGVKASEVRY